MSDYTEEDDGSDIYDYDSDAEPGAGIEDDNESDYDIPVSASEAKGKQKSTGIDARSLSLESLQDMINGDVRRVASITGLQPSIATILLQHYRWNEERLLEEYMDSPERVMRASGEPLGQDAPDPSPPPQKRARLDRAAQAHAKSGTFDCLICCVAAPLKDGTFRPRCGHRFCIECWREYIVTKVKDEGQCFFRCMQDGCPTSVDESAIEVLAPEAVVQRYKVLLQQSYVQCTAKLRFCPHPGCTQTVHCTSGIGSLELYEIPTVHCGATHAFCFRCGTDDDHRPLLCKFVAIWHKSARDDAGTSQWLRANTKSCPKCENSIEKNGGCNRILCRHCQFQFCWMCMKNWDAHGYNNSTCNAFVEPEPDAASNEAKKNLERWLFYFDRFNNHELSAKLDQELYERTEDRMLEVQETSQLSWIEAKFMKQAVDELTRCRVTLKWTYAMAYFLEKGNEKQIFEDIQADLEKAVEQLSQMLEENVEAETVKSLRQRMIDKTVYVQRRHEILLEDTATGLKEGRWVWTQ